jgi:hypothetical protein
LLKFESAALWQDMLLIKFFVLVFRPGIWGNEGGSFVAPLFIEQLTAFI